jgi:TATA-box binding protein (TBP) (component of TFIID and TFIIIB)
MSYKKLISELKNVISYDVLQAGIDSLPSDVNISTMTVCFSFNATLDIKNITKWLKLNPDTVIKVGDRELSAKTKKSNKKSITKMSDLLKEKTEQECKTGKKRGRKPKAKKNQPKKQKTKKNFYNQISIKVLVPGKQKNKPVNIKLFNNGAVQMTGCITIQDSLDAMYNCMNALNNVRAVIVKSKIKEVPFSSKRLVSGDIENYKIGMINSGFSIPFMIDRSKLHTLMLNNNIDAQYDRNVHASVIIKHNVENSDVTVLAFEKGSIIITGAKNTNQIMETYNYINMYLLENYVNVCKRAELSDNNILGYLE